MSQQGAGRFAGVASTCRVWGLIECVPAEEQEESEEEEPAAGKVRPRLVAGPSCVPAEEQERSEEEETAPPEPPRKRLRKRRKRMRAKSQPGEVWEGSQEETEVEDWWYLGLTRRAYRCTGASERLGELLRATRDFRQPPEIVDSRTFLETVSWAEEFDEFLWRQSSTWAEQVGYVHDFLRRKFVLG